MCISPGNEEESVTDSLGSAEVEITHALSPTLQDVVGLFKSHLQVSLLDGSDWLVERLGGDGFLSIRYLN